MNMPRTRMAMTTVLILIAWSLSTTAHEPTVSYESALLNRQSPGSRSVPSETQIGHSSSGGPFLYMVPAAAHAPGYSDTQWATDLVLHNPGDGSATVDVRFLESDQGNSNAESHRLECAPSSSMMVRDAILTIFSESLASGGLFFESSLPLTISSRTYNNPASGTYGQYVPGLAADSAYGENDEARLIQLTSNDGFRTNLGFVNATDRPLDLRVDLFRSSGGLLANRSIHLRPLEYHQLNRIIPISIDDAYAVVTTTTPQAGYFTYASVVDNESGDPVFVLPSVSSTTGNPVLVTAAAHVGGIGGTIWRTDLEVHNPGPLTAEFRIELLKSNQSNSSPMTSSFTLGTRKTSRFNDAVFGLFGFEGTGALRVVPTSGELMVTSRTYNNSPSGTYGQFIPGVGESAAVSDGAVGRLVQLASGQEFRTNIGLVNANLVPETVDLELFTGEGENIGRLSIHLSPLEHYQHNNIFASFTQEAIPDGYAEVRTTTPDGRVFAYASVVDNRSGDPVYIPASLDIRVPVQPPISSPSLSASTVSSTRIDLSWTSVEQAESYELYRGSTLLFVGQNRDFSDSGLQPGTEYCYRVRAANAAGAGPYSTQACAMTNPGPPTEAPILTVTGVSSSEIDLSWTVVDGADGYLLYFDSVVIYGGPDQNYRHHGLVNGVEYCYRVRAYNGEGNGPYSTQTCATPSGNPPASAPVLTATVVSMRQIDLSWTSVDEAEGYQLSGRWMLYDGPGLEFSDADLEPDTEYCYTVYAYNADGTGPISPEACATTFPPPPGSAPSLTAFPVTSDTVMLGWSDVYNADGYSVFRGSTPVYSGSDRSFTESGLTPGNSHCYRVFGRNASGEGPWSEQACATPQSGTDYAILHTGSNLVVIDVANPSVFVAEIPYQGPPLSGVDFKPGTFDLYGVSSRLYKIDVALGTATPIGSALYPTGPSPSCPGIDFDPVTGNLRVVGANGLSFRIDPESGQVISRDSDLRYSPGDPHAGLEPSVCGIAHTNNNHGATSTTLYGYSYHGGSVFLTIGSQGGSPDSPNSGMLHTVAAVEWPVFDCYYDLDVASPPSGADRMYAAYQTTLLQVDPSTGQTTDLGQIGTGQQLYLDGFAVFPPIEGSLTTPTLSATSASTTSIGLEWTQVPAADGYRLYRGELMIYNGSSLSYLDPGLEPDTAYCYTVLAYNSEGDGPLSQEVCATTGQAPPALPPVLSATAFSSSRVDLSWSTVSGATSYDLNRWASTIYAGSGQSFSDLGLSATTTYCYTVRAINPNGAGPWSSERCATTLEEPQQNEAPFFQPPNVAGGQITLTWTYGDWPTTPDGDEGYSLEESTTSPTSGFSQIDFIPGRDSPQTNILTRSNGIYYYRVRALRLPPIGLYSPYSNVEAATVSDEPPGPTQTWVVNDSSYPLISIKIDGVELAPTSSTALLPGHYLPVDLAHGTHHFEAWNGWWDSNQRFLMYGKWGPYEQQANTIEQISFTDPTINELLTQFSNSGSWCGFYFVGTNVHARCLRFYHDSTFRQYDDSYQNQTGSGTYEMVSYVSTPLVYFSIDYQFGTNQGSSFTGIFDEIHGYFMMENGPEGQVIEYTYENP